MSVHPLKSILMTQPWRQSQDSTRTPANLQQKSYSQPQKSSAPNLSTDHVSWLWMELTKIYGNLFLTKFGTHDNGTWFDTLKGLTPKALESGMERLRNLSGNGKFAEYPPNCLQFKALCMAFYDDLKLPKASDAYWEFKNSVRKAIPRWSHPVIEFVAKKMPFDFFSIDHDGIAYSVFKEKYEQVCHLIQQGHDLPKIDAPHRIKPARNLEVGKGYLNQIKQHIGV